MVKVAIREPHPLVRTNPIFVSKNITPIRPVLAIDYRSEDVYQRAKRSPFRPVRPQDGLAGIAGIPDLSAVPDLPYSISIQDIGLARVLASPAFRRRQEDLGRMATELMTLVQVEKIRPTVAEQIALEAIPKALERLAEEHVRGKIVAKLILTPPVTAFEL
jgi:NADPH:quinone reductase-like Zn-dependent oxidoreductase